MATFIPKPYKQEPITIRMAPDKIADLDKIVASFDISRSEFINQCIDYALEHMPETEKGKE